MATNIRCSLCGKGHLMYYKETPEWHCMVCGAGWNARVFAEAVEYLGVIIDSVNYPSPLFIENGEVTSL